MATGRKSLEGEALPLPMEDLRRNAQETIGHLGSTAFGNGLRPQDVAELVVAPSEPVTFQLSPSDPPEVITSVTLRSMKGGNVPSLRVQVDTEGERKDFFQMYLADATHDSISVSPGYTHVAYDMGPEPLGQASRRLLTPFAALHSAIETGFDIIDFKP